MDKETAKLALQFLQRISLQPPEIQSFFTVSQALQQIIRPKVEPNKNDYAGKKEVA